jgi:hypothetical protein
MLAHSQTASRWADVGYAALRCRAVDGPFHSLRRVPPQNVDQPRCHPAMKMLQDEQRKRRRIWRGAQQFDQRGNAPGRSYDRHAVPVGTSGQGGA